MSVETRQQGSKVIYYDGKIGGFTLGEWLVYWAWKYIISEITLKEYKKKLDYITPQTAGVNDSREWDEFFDYMKPAPDYASKENILLLVIICKWIAIVALVEFILYFIGG